MPKNFLTLWFFGTWTLSLKILLHLASCNHYLPYHQNHYFLLCIIQRFALTVTRQILTSFWSSVDDQSKSIIYIRLFRVHVQSSSPSVNISNYNFFPTFRTSDFGKHEMISSRVIIIWIFDSSFQWNLKKSEISVARSWRAKIPPSMLKIPQFCPPLNAKNPTLFGQKIPHFEVFFLKIWPLLQFLLHFYA